MEILKNIVLLVIGFVLLIKGADFFVDGSSSIAKRLKIPSIVIGLTIVALGTSFPELSVSLSAALSGSNAIAISNVIGSNLFNFVVVLGACACFCPVPVDRGVMKKEFPFSVLMSVLLALMFLDNINPLAKKANTGMGTLSRADGIILLILFVVFLVVTVKIALENRSQQSEEEGKMKNIPVSILCILGGVVAIKFGGDFVVDSAKAIALTVGMSETLVGLTIVAVGTSLPELVTSLVAARKGETNLAVGNVLGSNIFNILFILGTSCTICPIAVGVQSFIDITVLIILSLVTFAFSHSKGKIDRAEGITMLIMYVIYMAYAILR